MFRLCRWHPAFETTPRSVPRSQPSPPRPGCVKAPNTGAFLWAADALLARTGYWPWAGTCRHKGRYRGVTLSEGCSACRRRGTGRRRGLGGAWDAYRGVALSEECPARWRRVLTMVVGLPDLLRCAAAEQGWRGGRRAWMDQTRCCACGGAGRAWAGPVGEPVLSLEGHESTARSCLLRRFPSLHEGETCGTLLCGRLTEFTSVRVAGSPAAVMRMLLWCCCGGWKLDWPESPAPGGNRPRCGAVEVSLR